MSQFSARLRMHFIVFIWGFTGILGHLITIDAFTLVWHRMWMATVVLAIYLLLIGRSFKTTAKEAILLMLAGSIIAAHWVTFFYAIKVSTVSVTLACLSTGALFTAFLEPIFFRRAIDVREIVLGLSVVVGLYIIFNFETRYTLGIVIALTSAFLSALFSVINGIMVKTLKPNVITTYELTGGWMALSVFFLLTDRLNQELFTAPMSKGSWGYLNGDWTMIFILASVCTAYAFIESVKVMKVLSPYSVMLTINLEPVYGILMAALFLGESEQMSYQFYIGTGIILSVVFIEAYLRRQKQKITS
ncbi:DMT family transporter [Schleiferia thermophila]|uniref:EamA-like transporter family protein n=1 Tax=Schleiferia thermophila TaxID=884107 RepID=A0A369A5E6_9FLAO|nr:DMT family transporter [Schleiferia thermophila]RCX03628.1 EamA-like transporter family protein [Schleiferia thermophila]